MIRKLSGDSCDRDAARQVAIKRSALTVAILAQGTSRAVAVTQAFLHGFESHLELH